METALSVRRAVSFFVWIAKEKSRQSPSTRNKQKFIASENVSGLLQSKKNKIKMGKHIKKREN
jgi:uncharacterized protein YfaT (DUF1175 family)